MHTKIMHDLTIAIINKCFEFQNDWLKIIRIRCNCTKFILYRCIKEIKKFRTTSEFLSNIHQNLIHTKLYQDATKYKVSSISAH